MEDLPKQDRKTYDREFTLCPVARNCGFTTGEYKTQEVVVDVDQFLRLRSTTSDGFASQESEHLRENNYDSFDDWGCQSDTSSMDRQPMKSPQEDVEDAIDEEKLPREICFYRRRRDWDLPHKVKIHWTRESNVKYFLGVHKWIRQLTTRVSEKALTVIGTIVCYELQPLSSIRKSGQGTVLLKSVDASLYQLSLLASSSTLQSQTLWSDHWENLPLLLVASVYVPKPYRGLGLGLALVDDACRKPGRDIPWILTAGFEDEDLADYFGILGFVRGVFGDTFGARWNDGKHNPQIADLCPHFPTGHVVAEPPHEEEVEDEGSEMTLRVNDVVTLSSFKQHHLPLPEQPRVSQSIRTKARFLRQLHQRRGKGSTKR